MLGRRKFIGSIAAATTLGAIASSPSLSLISGVANAAAPLRWTSQVIDTVSHTRHNRKPVVTAVDLQTDGRLMAIVGDDHFVSLYDINSRRYLDHLKQHTDWVRAAKFSPDGSQLVTTGNDRKLIFWATDNPSKPQYIRRLKEAAFDLAFSPDGNQIAICGFEKQIRIYDDKGTETQVFEASCPDMHSVRFSNDGSLLAAGGRDGHISVFSMSDGSEVADFRAHRRRIRSLRFTDDNTIVSAGDDQIVKFTNPLRTTESVALPRLSSKLYATELLPNNLVATSGSDNMIHVWDLTSRSEIGSLNGHTGTVSCMASNDRLLVSGSYDTTVRVWTIEGDSSAANNGLGVPAQAVSGSNVFGLPN